MPETGEGLRKDRPSYSPVSSHRLGGKYRYGWFTGYETIEEIRTFDREEFNSDRRFYTRLNDVGEYIAETAMQEPPMEVNTVWDMLNEIEDENLYRALLTVDKRTLQIVLLKMQGYSLKEIAPMVDLSVGAVYARLDHLRKKLRKLL